MSYKVVFSTNMIKLFIFLFFIFCFSLQGFSSTSLDSLGMKTENGKKYIIHEVEAGETLYALSRKYNVGVQEIKDANSGSLVSLNIGQKVLIPFIIQYVQKGAKMHTVRSSETLFSISRLYNVKVEDLKRWNNLADNAISIGQDLVVREISVPAKPIVNSADKNKKTHTVEQSQTVYSISRMYGISTAELKEWNDLQSDYLDIGQVLIVSSSQNVNETVGNSSMLPRENNNQVQTLVVEKEEMDLADEKDVVAQKTNFDRDVNTSINKAATTSTVAALPVVAEDEKTEDITKPAEKIVQKGLCEVIENAPDTKKYLAFHRDAPVGTIMQVRNEMNNQSVFVRVVSSIPKTGDNAKVILQISKKAFDRLGAVDKRFPVEISYIP